MITMFFRKAEFRAINAKLVAAEKQIADLSAEARASIFDETERGEVFEVRGADAHISISGLLLTQHDPLLSWFGVSHTGYDQIKVALTAAEQNPAVERIVLKFNTPGGAVNGLDPVAEQIAKSEKHTTAIVLGQADSAGYYLASQADEILAESRGSEVGSIGSVITTYDDSKALEAEGIERVTLTNTASADKRPDIATDEGRAVLVAYLDDLYEIFEERIIEGRNGAENFSIENVRGLKGRVVTSKKAISLGLIDGMATDTADAEAVAEEDIPTTTNDGGAMSFDFDALCADNEELKPHVDGLAACAATAERERVAGLLSVAGAHVPKEVSDAIESGMSKADLAIALCEAKKPEANNTNEIPAVDAAATPEQEIPEDDKNQQDAKALEDLLGRIM